MGFSWTALALAPVLMAAFPQSAAAQTVWTGNTSDDWMVGSNWSTGTVPTGNVAINRNTPNPTVLGVSAPVTATIAGLSMGTTTGTTSALTIRNGSTLSSPGTTPNRIGQAAATHATLTVTGVGSAWSTAGSTLIGTANTSTGTLNISSNGVVTIASSLTLGQTGGNGTLNITSGGALTTSGNAVMAAANSASTASISGPGSLWSVGGYLRVGAGNGANGVLNLDNGGVVTATDDIFIGGPSLSSRGTGTATVTGVGTHLSSNATLNVGGAGTGTLTISDGAVATANSVVMAHSIAGAESGTGTLNLLSGGVLETRALTSAGVMRQVNFDSGTVRATGSNTTFVTGFTGNELNIGAGGLTLDTAAFDTTADSPFTGTGALTKTGLGTLVLTGDSAYQGGTTIAAGTLQLGNGGNTGRLTGDLINNGTLVFNRLGTLTLAGVISGSGGLVHDGPGVTVLEGDNSYSGTTSVNAGTLRINGNQSAANSAVYVAKGATLGGAGTIGGAVTVADGGHLAPGNSPGTLTIGPLTLNAASILDFELGAANAVGNSLNDLIHVNGDLVLDGTLNVSPSASGTFGAGIYRLIDYTGNLMDNGLELGLMPAGSSNYLQTSIANQVNLINTLGLVLNYWDGTADARNSGIGGGNGIWQAAAGNDNWTLSDGSLNAGYQDSSLAVFDATAGTVAVDASHGDIRVSGMQFAADGYRLEGDSITLASGLTPVRVGDGTDAGSAFTATIASALIGEGTLDKTDLGTLVLTGENVYSGGTRVSAGTLQVGDGNTTGSLLGDVANEGILAFNRSNDLTFAGVISGTGSIEQIGSGSTMLTGVNTYTGATTIASGTLALAGAGSIAASSGVANDGTFDISATDTGASIMTLSGSGSVALGSKALTLTAPTGTFAGVIDGAAGTLNKEGPGTWTLTGMGSRLDTLNVHAGTLELTASGGLAAHSMSVSAGATLSSAGTLAGTAANDTLALAGTLIGNTSLLDGDDHVEIAEGATFAQATFDGGAGSDTLELAYSGALSLQNAPATTAFERLIKRGNGAFTLSGNVDEFSDSITVAGGTLQLSDANIVTHELRIETGVTVTGRGALTGSLVNSGMLSPGNSPGTIRIGGNFNQAASGTLISEITRNGTDLIDVAGMATLAGAHQITIEYGRYLDGTTQTLIRANGGITGDFASVQFNPSALMTAERQLTANAETVRFERRPVTSLSGLSDGRARFASYLEEQIAAGTVDPAMSTYIDSLLQQSTAEGAANLLGERTESVASVTQNSVSILGAGFARTVFERFTVSDGAQCVPTQPGSNDTLNCFWAHGLRQWGNASGDARYDWTTDGGQIGVDRELSSEWTLGTTFAYGDTHVHDRFGGRNEARSKMGGFYMNYGPGRLSVGALAFYSGNDNDTRRSVLVGSEPRQARAEFDGDSYGAGVRVGYRVTSESAPLVRPFIEAFYDHLDGTTLVETGAGNGNLSARVHGRDGVRGTAGVQLADNFEGYGRVFRPALDVGVTRQFGDTRSTLDLQPFSNAASFRTYGPSLDRTAYVAKASLSVSLGENSSVALSYGGEVADDYSQQEGNLNVRVAW